MCDKAETDKLNELTLPDKLNVAEYSIQPKKTDIDVDSVVLAWRPAVLAKEQAR